MGKLLDCCACSVMTVVALKSQCVLWGKVHKCLLRPVQCLIQNPMVQNVQRCAFPHMGGVFSLQ